MEVITISRVVLKGSFKSFVRRKAVEAMDELRENLNLKMTDKELRKTRNFGRK